MISIRTAGTYDSIQNNLMKFTYDFHDTTELFCRATFSATKYNCTDEYGSGTLSNPVTVPMDCVCFWNGKIYISSSSNIIQ